MSKPFFSILMPTYNQAVFLKPAIESVLAQTFGDYELIVVNDGSADDTEEVMERYAAKDGRIRIFHKENGGTGSALNRAAAEAEADWLCWLSSDDLFLPSHLAEKSKLIRNYPETGFIHSSAKFLIDAENKLVDPPPGQSDIPHYLQTLRLLRVNYVNGITITGRREEITRIGFNENLRYAQDYAMWLALSLCERFSYIAEPLAVTRIHKGQGTAAAPVGGPLDGAFVGLDLLNKNKFSALIRFADLENDFVLSSLVGETLINMIDDNSYLKMAGFEEALAARFSEWINEQPQGLKERIVGCINNFLDQYGAVIGDRNTSIIEDLAEASSAFTPYNGGEFLVRKIERLKRANEGLMADAFEKYLALGLRPQ